MMMVCILENFPFTEDKNEIIKFYDRGGKRVENYFDLIEYFYDCDIFVYSDDNRYEI